jgi:hypothetical protein
MLYTVPDNSVKYIIHLSRSPPTIWDPIEPIGKSGTSIFLQSWRWGIRRGPHKWNSLGPLFILIRHLLYTTPWSRFELTTSVVIGTDCLCILLFSFRNKNCMWRPYLLMDRDEMKICYRGPAIDASYQVSVHLAEGFQRRRLKCEKLSDYFPGTI